MNIQRVDTTEVHLYMYTLSMAEYTTRITVLHLYIYILFMTQYDTGSCDFIFVYLDLAFDTTLHKNSCFTFVYLYLVYDTI